MTSQQENIALAQSVYDCGFASDWTKLETLLSEDFENENGKVKRMLPFFYDTALLDRFLKDRAKG